MDMNINTFTPEEADIEIAQSYSSTFFVYQAHQVRNESSHVFSGPQGRTLFNDRGFQQFAVEALESGLLYRSRASSRGNISTACSLSPKHQKPQNPENMPARLPSTKSAMSGGRILDESSEDEDNINEFREKTTKSSKNMVDEHDWQADERGIKLDIMECSGKACKNLEVQRTCSLFGSFKSCGTVCKSENI